MTEEERFCESDADCSETQYCYTVSRQCVDYTRCVRYNRQEAPKYSRQPSQCGPCLPGYISEELSTGEMAWLCKKDKAYDQSAEPDRLNSVLAIWITIGALVACLLAMVVGIFLKRRSSTRQDNSRKQWGELCVVSPSAPPVESSPFIEDRGIYPPFNNNHNLKDKNNLVCTSPFKCPDWVNSNPNYRYNFSDENLNVSEQGNNAPPQVPPVDSNTWTGEQLTIQVGNGNLSEYGVEQVDNTRNAVLVQRNNASSSDETDNNGSPSGSGDARNNRERFRGSNILITQKISMNVNVHNSD